MSAIDDVIRGDGEAARALVQDPAAAMDIINRLTTDGAIAWSLGPLLVEIGQRAPLQGLAGLWRQTGYFEGRIIASRTLVRHGSTEAVAVLAEGLQDDRRRVAITALGDTGLESARPLLEEELRRSCTALGVDPVTPDLTTIGVEADASEIELLPVLLASLYKVGSTGAPFPLLLSLLRFQSEDPYVAAEAVRDQAARALQVVVVDGMCAALIAALSEEPAGEVVDNGVAALAYLGSPRVIQQFLGWSSGDGALAATASYRLRDLLGPLEGPDPGADALLESWNRLSAAARDDLCYRGGLPLMPDRLVLASADHNRRVAVLRELAVITGLWLGYDELFGELEWYDYAAAVRQWSDGVRDGFTAGGLYKHGRQRTMPEH